MRVTEKGQVTIPKHIRDKLGIGPGSEVDFVEDSAGGVELVRLGEGAEENAAVARLERWVEKVRGTGDPDLSTDAVMLATRGRRLGDPH